MPGLPAALFQQALTGDLSAATYSIELLRSDVTQGEQLFWALCWEVALQEHPDGGKECWDLANLINTAQTRSLVFHELVPAHTITSASTCIVGRADSSNETIYLYAAVEGLDRTCAEGLLRSKVKQLLDPVRMNAVHILNMQKDSVLDASHSIHIEVPCELIREEFLTTPRRAFSWPKTVLAYETAMRLATHSETATDGHQTPALADQEPASGENTTSLSADQEEVPDSEDASLPFNHDGWEAELHPALSPVVSAGEQELWASEYAPLPFMEFSYDDFEVDYRTPLSPVGSSQHGSTATNATSIAERYGLSLIFPPKSTDTTHVSTSGLSPLGSPFTSPLPAETENDDPALEDMTPVNGTFGLEGELENAAKGNQEMKAHVSGHTANAIVTGADVLVEAVEEANSVVKGADVSVGAEANTSVDAADVIVQKVDVTIDEADRVVTTGSGHSNKVLSDQAVSGSKSKADGGRNGKQKNKASLAAAKVTVVGEGPPKTRSKTREEHDAAARLATAGTARMAAVAIAATETRKNTARSTKTALAKVPSRAGATKKPSGNKPTGVVGKGRK